MHGSALMEELGWVLDEVAFPGAVAAVGKRWRGTWLEEGEAGAGRV